MPHIFPGFMIPSIFPEPLKDTPETLPLYGNINRFRAASSFSFILFSFLSFIFFYFTFLYFRHTTQQPVVNRLATIGSPVGNHRQTPFYEKHSKKMRDRLSGPAKFLHFLASTSAVAAGLLRCPRTALRCSIAAIAISTSAWTSSGVKAPTVTISQGRMVE